MATARRRRTGRTPLTVGLIALAVIVVGVFLGFTKDIPFTHGFRVKATFESANSLRLNSPVRIAGVAVGKVKKVEAKEGTDEAVVTLELKKSALPIHEDATAKIRPRIFLEGNFFVDLKPGTPSSPKLEDGDVIKVTRTSTPVQLDEVLTALQSDTRQDLRDLLDGLATGPELQAERGRRPRRRPVGARPDRGRVLQRRLQGLARRAQGRGPGQRGAARHGARPRRRAPAQGHRAHDRRADPQRGPSEGPDHELQRHHGGVRERGEQPARLDPPARADARERQRRARVAQRGLPARRVPSRATSCPAYARRPPPSRRRSRGSGRPGA